jgi:hypothetical protein
MRPLERLDHVRRKNLAGFGNDACIQIGSLPIYGNARRVHRAHRSFGDFRTDAVTWD